MTIYDVYRGQDIKACVRRHDDGQKDWAFARNEAEWRDFWWPPGSITAIEQAIDAAPGIDELPIEGFTIRRRRE